MHVAVVLDGVNCAVVGVNTTPSAVGVSMTASVGASEMDTSTTSDMTPEARTGK